MGDEQEASYYVIDGSSPDQMLLYSLKKPGRLQSWCLGCRFRAAPDEPVVARIIEGNERAEVLPYFGTPPIMSNEFYEALCEAGVDNLEVYDAIIRSADGTIEHRGFKAFNVVGVVRAADLSASQFAAGTASRLIDASIESLVIDEEKVKGMLLFRLAEFTGAVIVHRRVKEFIESRGFPNVVFREPSDFLS